MDTEKYFESISEQTDKAYDLAGKARQQSKDPEKKIDIPIATDLPEKASELVIAAMFPELKDQGVAERIRELEDEYGKNDERVAFSIAREIAEGRFVEFDDKERACNAGIRVGVSYMTGGITTAPLEGIGEIKIRENNDGTKYLSVYYAGPIRSAGGTASAMSVLLADYVRIGVGLDKFKPGETVIKRYGAEVEDYYNRVTAKQYNPERKETEMIAENVPVEVTGNATESLDVSNYKDLDRVETNRIRGGMCLVYLDGLPLKAPKIKKRIEKWGEEFGLEHWNWVEDYLKLQKEIHSSGSDKDSDSDKEEKKYTPSDKYLGSLTAGRPVFAHPGRKGGFRLRYGHSRANGLAAVSFHPATMEITERFIAIGTQLKTEYPGKATVGTVCDTIHPPVVRLEDGTVQKVETREEAKELENKIDQILFLGDILVPYGEFVENGKRLLASPYVSEWWEKELEKELEEQNVKLGRDFSQRDPTPAEAFKISEKLGVPLHPKWTYHFNETSSEKLEALVEGLENGEKFNDKAKKALEDILIEHQVEDGKVKLGEDEQKVLKRMLKGLDKEKLEDIDQKQHLELISENSGIKLRDPAPHYIGARMGRPEKAEKRTIKGKPQLLFPCGKKEGGRMRNLAAAYNQKMHGEKGIVKERIIHNRDPDTGEYTYFSYNPENGNETVPLWFCTNCGKEFMDETEKCGKCGNDRLNRYKNTEIDVKNLVDDAMENLGMRQLPELLKSVRGMSGKHKHVESIEKGLLRQKHGLYVNKDGTVRYDASDIPMTHFKPREISVSVEKLKEQGYKKDVNGEPLENKDQILELKPQDIIIPDGEKSMPASDYLLRVAKYVDELLEEFYDLEPYYQAETKKDLVGKLVIGLAPHTSGGTVGRIIGFTDAKGIYAHPYWHAAKRRNCDGDEDAILLLMDGLLNFSREFLPDMTGARSVTKDTRIFTSIDGELRVKRADELVDGVLDEQGYEVREDGFEVSRDFEEDIKAVSFDREGNVELCDVSALIRHDNDKQVFKLKTSRGQISVTEDHSVFVTEGDKIEAKPVRDIEEGDCIIVPSNFELDIESISDEIDLFEVLPDEKCFVSVDEAELSELKPEIEQKVTPEIKERYGGHNIYRYKTGRRNASLAFYKDVGVVPSCKVKVKANADPINRYLETDEHLFRLLGYLLSEGNLESGRIYNNDMEIIEDIQNCIEELTGVRKQFNTDSREDRENDNHWVRIPATLRAVLNQLGLENKKADSKIIPSFVLGAEKRLQEEFLKAYRRGDGSIYEEKGFSKLYTQSGEMASQLTYIVRRLGFKSSTRIAGDTWEVLYSEWGNKDPYWPLWEIKDSVRHALRNRGLEYEDVKSWMSNYRGNDRMKTAGKTKIENLYEDGVEELAPVAEGNISVERVVEKQKVDYGDDYVYDLEVPENQNFLCGPHPVFAHNTMDAPLILSTVLNADEVDDEAWAVETVSEYPLSFYEESLEYKKPWELDTSIEIGEDIVHSDEPYSHGYTHETSSVEDGPTQSEYVTLDEMSEKTSHQLGIGRKLKAVDENAVAELLLNKHFLPDIRGNLRSFSSQKMRCVDCNTKFRRVPLTNQTIAASGKETAQCPECDGKVLLTISEGTIKKYLQPSKDIIDEYEISPYTRQQILILNKTMQSLFGKDQRQSGLKQFTA